MTTRNDGGPAFPGGSVDLHGGEPSTSALDSGMSLRDWLAGHADVAGYQLGNHEDTAKYLGIDPPLDESMDELVKFSFRVQAALRYRIADAMLAERAK